MQYVENYPGMDWSFQVTIKQTTGGVESVYDLTGATLEATISRGSIGWTGTPTVVGSPTAGVALITVPRATTANFTPGPYEGEIVATKSGSKQNATRFRVGVLARPATVAP